MNITYIRGSNLIFPNNFMLYVYAKMIFIAIIILMTLLGPASINLFLAQLMFIFKKRFWYFSFLNDFVIVTAVPLLREGTPPSFPSPTKDGGKGRSKLFLLKFRLRHVFF